MYHHIHLTIRNIAKRQTTAPLPRCAIDHSVRSAIDECICPQRYFADGSKSHEEGELGLTNSIFYKLMQVAEHRGKAECRINMHLHLLNCCMHEGGGVRCKGIIPCQFSGIGEIDVNTSYYTPPPPPPPQYRT